LGYPAWGRGYARIHDGRHYGWISDGIPQDTAKAVFSRVPDG